MSVILVTGGTGPLGRLLVPRLEAAGHSVRVLSRTAGTHRGDLATGEGLDAALRGVDTVVHLAVGKHHARETQRLVDASASAGVAHLVFISIPGTDRIPIGYYRAKAAAERIVESGPVPYTTLRAAQFHTLAIKLLESQRLLPLLIVPDIRLQPIDPDVVAGRLADLATGAPTGRVPDIGGPEVRRLADLARVFAAHRGWRKRVVALRLRGRLGAALAGEPQLVPSNPVPGATFEQFL